ncbi:MAG: hypothetical protein WDN46_09875 [Methylocella sp.]
MPDFGLRNLGTIIPGARGAEPIAPTPPAARAVTKAVDSPAPAASRLDAVFAADDAGDADALSSNALGLDAPLSLLAELAAHGRTQTPFAIGLLGPSGSGKSLALNKLVRLIETLSVAARGAATTPFLTSILTLRVNAADLDGHPAEALAGVLYARLAKTFPALALEAAHAARDPGVAAREAFERLDAARLKLEAERRSLEEADSRRARLTDTVLYETPGSQVDAYAARRRNRIKTTMARFGISGDPIPGYKDMVRTIADSSAPARLNFAFGAFWALKGQMKLIITAILLVLAGIGLGAAVDAQDAWLGLLRRNEQLVSAANWIGAHMDWLLSLRQLAFFGAGLALVVNVWRALRLLQLAFRGASLLRSDLSDRRRETDGNFGHQARRVQDLAAEVDNLSRRATEAERRAGALHSANPALAEPSPFTGDVVRQQAQRFIAAVGALVQRRGQSNAKTSEAPQRIIIALDNLDLAPTSRAREILIHVRSLLGPGYVSLIAADPAAFGGDAFSLDKWIQVPLQVGKIAAQDGFSAQVRNILGSATSKQALTFSEAGRSALDEPLSEAETNLLTALAPLAGRSARSVKRFVNLYRLLRAEWPNQPEQRGALAFMLALDAGGTPEEIAAVDEALAGAAEDAEFDWQKGDFRVAQALGAAAGAGGPVTGGAARRAAATVRLFSFNS